MNKNDKKKRKQQTGGRNPLLTVRLYLFISGFLTSIYFFLTVHVKLILKY